MFKSCEILPFILYTSLITPTYQYSYVLLGIVIQCFRFHTLQLMYDVKVCVNNCKQSTKHLDEEAQLEISTVLFQLYLAMRDFVVYAKFTESE